MTASFYYVVTWRVAAVARRKLAELDTGYYVTSLPSGDVAFMFPNQPVRKYAEIRKIFGRDGEPIRVQSLYHLSSK